MFRWKLLFMPVRVMNSFFRMDNGGDSSLVSVNATVFGNFFLQATELVLEKEERLPALLFTIMSLEESEQFGLVFRQISDLMHNETLKTLLVLDIVQFIY